MSEPSQSDVLSLFWAPACAIGSHGPGGPNAQLSVSVFGAGVVPDRPRLLVNLWKDNHTASLVAAAGTLAITVLSAEQAHLVDVLGLQTGREGPKLDRLDFALTPAGDPYFPGGAALLDCDVIEPFDLGDAWAFLVAVRDRRRLSGAPPLSRQELMDRIGPDIRERWAAKIAATTPVYREAMHWIQRRDR